MHAGANTLAVLLRHQAMGSGPSNGLTRAAVRALTALATVHPRHSRPAASAVLSASAQLLMCPEVAVSVYSGAMIDALVRVFAAPTARSRSRGQRPLDVALAPVAASDRPGKGQHAVEQPPHDHELAAELLQSLVGGWPAYVLQGRPELGEVRSSFVPPCSEAVSARAASVDRVTTASRLLRAGGS